MLFPTPLADVESYVRFPRCNCLQQAHIYHTYSCPTFN